MDNFKFSDVLTKRTVYSEIAQLFDPLGLCGPVVFPAKVFMQSLWTQSIDSCSRVLSGELQSELKLFRNELVCLRDIKIPRCVIVFQWKLVELHGFCNASESGYGACVYKGVPKTILTLK